MYPQMDVSTDSPCILQDIPPVGLLKIKIMSELISALHLLICQTNPPFLSAKDLLVPLPVYGSDVTKSDDQRRGGGGGGGGGAGG